MLASRGVQLEEICLTPDDDQYKHGRPVRAIVKELMSAESGVNKSNLRTLLSNIRFLNKKLKIYNRDKLYAKTIILMASYSTLAPHERNLIA